VAAKKQSATNPNAGKSLAGRAKKPPDKVGAKAASTVAPRRAKHPKREVDAAVKQLFEAKWTFRKGGGHAWGVFQCPEDSREGCQISVWSTPKSPENHGKQIKKALEKCPHARK
jgi:hypothetical protein